MLKFTPIVSNGVGEIDPLKVADYSRIGGFAALKKAMRLSPLEIISEVKTAKLLGRGGAAYPAGSKWEQLFRIKERPKFIVCNADEGEPGTFKDRLILEKVPLRLIEGMTIAAYVFKSFAGYIYVRGEYRGIQKGLKEAIQNAKREGLLGQKILGTSFSFEIEVISGAGAYVCGENSALLNSTEGKVGRPRVKPPHLAEVGLFLRPTLVNNVESFTCIPSIVLDGGENFLRMGHPEGGGSKLICLSGHINQPGVYEIPLGKLTLKEIISSLGGGIKNGQDLNFIHLGGQSGPIASKESLNLLYSYHDLRKNGLSVGSGAVVVMDQSVSLTDYLYKVTEFFLHESCGKCVPCREGNRLLLKYLARLKGPEPLSSQDFKVLSQLITTMSRASFCGLGQSAATALKTAWQAFPQYFVPSGLDLPKPQIAS
ncbi:MAG: SLBB domain-containing protein [Deltaproteobacteria bacterium]|jgi:NADH-quinone oxidoreductase subunit F|nr:SLBB domain-containing protein [Deltaproteobacteria bacterium]